MTKSPAIDILKWFPRKAWLNRFIVGWKLGRIQADTNLETRLFKCRGMADDGRGFQKNPNREMQHQADGAGARGGDFCHCSNLEKEDAERVDDALLL